MAGCSEQPLAQLPIRSDDCLREVKLDQLGEQLKRCDQVVAAFPRNPGPLNDRYLLRSLLGPNQSPAACDDMRRATALAKQAKPGSLDLQLQRELKLRLELCKPPPAKSPLLH